VQEKIWTIKDIIEWSKDYFEKKGLAEARLNIELIICKILNKKRLDLYLNFDQPLKSEELKLIREYIIRRGKREPLQYILGEVEFADLKFKVDKRALIPRPETEELVYLCNKIIKENKYQNIIDIGTGTGCIPISLKNMNNECNFTAIDISENAISLAKENSTLNNINEINWLNCNFLEFEKYEYFNNKDASVNQIKENIFQQNYDLVISNPPYVSISEFNELDTELKDHEPSIALTDFADGLTFYKKLVTFSSFNLSYGGRLVAELGFNLSNLVSNLFINEGYEVEIIKDLQKIDRIIVAKKKVNF
jgi:release factor glutamine methyltransferase